LTTFLSAMRKASYLILAVLIVSRVGAISAVETSKSALLATSARASSMSAVATSVSEVPATCAAALRPAISAGALSTAAPAMSVSTS
jgi:hypothetical protein